MLAPWHRIPVLAIALDGKELLCRVFETKAVHIVGVMATGVDGHSADLDRVRVPMHKVGLVHT